MEVPFDTRHLLATSRGPLSEVVSRMTEVPTERVKELIRIGSIYVNGSRSQNDDLVGLGAYLRLHLKPKRYNVSKIDWKNRVVFENEHLLVVNKPKGIPVHPTVDNMTENILHQLSLALGQPLLITQRLDVLTTGLFVIAKTPDFQRQFNRLLKEKQVHKIYEALLEHPVSLGLHRHFMKTSPRSPKLVAPLAPTGEETLWKECLLKVLNFDRDFRAEIELLTGRTHQIRAQLAFMGAPLAGDQLYGSSQPEENFALLSKKLAFNCPLSGKSLQFAAPDA